MNQLPSEMKPSVGREDLTYLRFIQEEQVGVVSCSEIIQNHDRSWRCVENWQCRIRRLRGEEKCWLLRLKLIPAHALMHEKGFAAQPRHKGLVLATFRSAFQTAAPRKKPPPQKKEMSGSLLVGNCHGGWLGVVLTIDIYIYICVYMYMYTQEIQIVHL